jgi:predicted transglutaminase-like cysteine proteinase
VRADGADARRRGQERRHDDETAVDASRRHVIRSAVIALSLLAALVPSRAWDADRMTHMAQRRGPHAAAGVRLLQPVLQQAATLEDRAKVVAINQFFNRQVLFREDIEVWKVVDHWASPLETLEKGEGDCEDYAIAKYFSLVATGVPVGKLRMVYVRAQLGGSGGPTQAHMVLAYYAAPGADPLILDNLIADVRPASRRPDLTPVFSFNSEGLWEGVGMKSAGEPVSRLSRWRDVLAKARDEGFLVLAP